MAVQKVGLLVIALMATSLAAAREAPSAPAQRLLEARLRSSLLAESGYGSGTVECWGALIELRSCTNEVVLFFLNGEAYMGDDCCRAIRIITHQCWPIVLTSIGFTAEEGDVLLDYCDMGTLPLQGPVAAPLPPSAPAPQATAIYSTGL